jgi:hypothetical protein
MSVALKGNNDYIYNIIVYAALMLCIWLCLYMLRQCFVRRVWRYQMGNQNPYIEEEQTTHWTQKKVQKDKQRSTTHTQQTKDRVTEPQYKPGVNSGNVCITYLTFTIHT